MKKIFIGHLRFNYTLLAFGAVDAWALPCTGEPMPATPPPATPKYHATINSFNPHLLPYTPELQALHERQEEANADYASGYAALRAGKFSEAEGNLRSSILADPKGETYLALGEALVDQWRISEALQAYGTVFDPPANISWGRSYMRRAHLEYAVLLVEAGRWTEAVADYDLGMSSLSVGDAPEIAAHFDPDDPLGRD